MDGKTFTGLGDREEMIGETEDGHNKIGYEVVANEVPRKESGFVSAR